MAESTSKSLPIIGASSLEPLVDSFGRWAEKLRISVTDRCNFRCQFCMPTHPVWLPHRDILTFEEIAYLARILAPMGVSKIRLSGGEPLMRRDIEKLVRLLVDVPGVKKVDMTTNGMLLADMAVVLKKAGLNGVTVSLHSLKQDRFEAITGTKNTFDSVLAGIQSAKEAKLKVKINSVMIKNCNEDELLDFAKLAYEGNVTVRFIEYMPFDGKKLWGMEKVFGGKDMIEAIRTRYELVPLPREHGSTAKNYKFAHGSEGEIGVITSMTEPFCGDCDRIRLKANGKIVPCLFSEDEYDVKSLLRGGATEEEIVQFIRACFWKKSAGVETMLKENMHLVHIRPMHTIGG